MGWQWSESKRDEGMENMTEVQSQVSTLSIQHYQRRRDLGKAPHLLNGEGGGGSTILNIFWA